jgi:hypothetical protein
MLARGPACGAASAMAEIINLKARRKQLARDDAAQAAKESRIRHGRTRAEKARDRAAAEREARARENAKLDR